jgi:quercetin dioxygenase-like cupin family protein
MNALTQVKKIRTLPLLMAPALVILAGFTTLPVDAAPPLTCGLTITSLIGPNPPQPGQFDEIMSYAKIGDWKARINIDEFDLYIVEVTIQPGGWLGWHSHPGLSFVVVKSGTATFYEADGCAQQVIPTGGTFFEPAGDVHTVRNEGNVDLVNVVIQLVPTGAPRAIGEPDPGCLQLTCPYGQ